MADQENKDFSEDIADQSFEQQNGDANNTTSNSTTTTTTTNTNTNTTATTNNGNSGNGTAEPTENGQDSQEER